MTAPSAASLGGFVCTHEDMHPMNCLGAGECRHCDRRVIYQGEAVGRSTPNNVRDWVLIHDPATCPLCDPEYDFMPNEHRSGGAA